MSGPDDPGGGAAEHLLCVLDFQEGSHHEEMLRLAAWLAHALGKHLHTVISINENLLRSAALSRLGSTGVESGRSLRFDLRVLRDHLEDMATRIPKYLGTITRSLPVPWTIKDVGLPSQENLASWEVPWRHWSLPLTFLPRPGAGIAGRPVVLLTLRQVTSGEQALLARTTRALEVDRVLERDFAADPVLPDASGLAAEFRSQSPGLVVIVLPAESSPEILQWVEFLQGNLPTNLLLLR